MNATHQKKPYKAEALQWQWDNTADVLDMLRIEGDEAHVFGHDHANPECIVVRFKTSQPGRKDIETIAPGYWIVRGENGHVKCYPDDVFRVKYEKIV